MLERQQRMQCLSLLPPLSSFQHLPHHPLPSFSNLSTVLLPSARKTHVIGGEKKKELGWIKYVVDETKWPGTVRCCGKTFSRRGSFRYHVEKDHVKSRRFRLGEQSQLKKTASTHFLGTTRYHCLLSFNIMIYHKED